jgi:hypothetical protein
VALSKVKCTAPHAIDLDTGQVLAPGEWGKADLDQPHNADLVASGLLTAAAEPEKAPKKEPS